jgi:prepilin-type N-terminal cleavage/methylation domain-containing protein
MLSLNGGNQDQHSRQGFSLVEMLVALAFISLLMAGMATVFRGSVRTFQATGETSSAQNRGRWALEQISDDIAQAGFLFPDRILPTRIQSGAESLFQVLPDQSTVTQRVDDTNPTATTAETITADALQFFMDVPLPVFGELAVATSGEGLDASGTSVAASTAARVTFDLGTQADLLPGDVAVICDSGEHGNWEHPLVSGTPVLNPIVFETSTAEFDKYTALGVDLTMKKAHPAGTPVYFVRPAQLIRYSVRAVALDPSTAATVPCLVRQQANYPATTAATVNWTNVPSQIVAENVSGFRIDLSFDGGATWTRPGAGATWAGFQTNANTSLATSGLSGFQTITDTTRRDWFRSIPCLLRIDLTTRTSVRREEYSAAPGSRSWRLRNQTLMISPRNFGVGM